MTPEEIFIEEHVGLFKDNVFKNLLHELFN
jgi:hypothetical protein